MAKKNKLSVDTDAVSNSVKTIREQIDAIEEVHRYITGKALSELDSVWSGPAKEAYASELAAIKENLASFAKSGADLNNALDKARQSYDTAERNALNKVASLPR